MRTIGDEFPKFQLRALSGLSIGEMTAENAFIDINGETYAERWKVIFFYPMDFTFICPTEILGFASLYQDFQRRNAQILACSTDSEYAHWAWRKHSPRLSEIPFPLLSDMSRSLSQALGVINPTNGVAQRALFIVDPQNIIRFVMVTDENVGRSPEETLRVLDALQTKALCPCSWTKGQKTIDAFGTNI
ncbi:MAG: peroxiredoxin [Puniceicoccales bacterium]|jgi:peroxiredoxin (alkyl hydroperoxide reductase subunit C)|nr:peroxiredoxin [Puniceicoccales bacterium]